MNTVTMPERTKLKRLPPYNVILLNDDDHSFAYVMAMLKELFGFPLEKGEKAAKQVHEKGRCVLVTVSKELAELKQEQIHGYGPDKTISKCKGSMSCLIEPAE